MCAGRKAFAAYALLGVAAGPRANWIQASPGHANSAVLLAQSFVSNRALRI
jgi:hypothetical protein